MKLKTDLCALNIKLPYMHAKSLKNFVEFQNYLLVAIYLEYYFCKKYELYICVQQT